MTNVGPGSTEYLKPFGFVHLGNPSVSGDTSWGDCFFEKKVV